MSAATTFPQTATQTKVVQARNVSKVFKRDAFEVKALDELVAIEVRGAAETTPPGIGDPGVEHRQRKMYANFAYSVRWLSPELRNTLSKLWVFHTPFLADVAVAVIATRVRALLSGEVRGNPASPFSLAAPRERSAGFCSFSPDRPHNRSAPCGASSSSPSSVGTRS